VKNTQKNIQPKLIKSYLSFTPFFHLDRGNKIKIISILTHNIVSHIFPFNLIKVFPIINNHNNYFKWSEKMRHFLKVVMLVVVIVWFTFGNTHAQTQAVKSSSDTPPQTASTPLPVETFTKYDVFSDIKLSPSGKYAAYLGGKIGRSNLIIITVKDIKPVNSVRCRDGFEFEDFHWISDRRIIYELAERQPSGLLASTGEMFAIDVDGKNHGFIFGYRAGEMQTGTRLTKRQDSYSVASLINPLLNDEKHVLIREMPFRQLGYNLYYDPDAKPIITLLDTYDGDKQKLEVAPYSSAEVMTDQQDRVRFAIGLNSNLQYAVSWKPDPDGGWVDFDLPGFREDSIIPLIMSEDGESVFFEGTASDSRYTDLFRLDLKTKETTKIFGLDDNSISSVILDLMGKRIIGVLSYVDKPVVYWLDKKDLAARIRASLTNSFKGQTVQIVTASKDGSLAVIFVDSDINPGDYYLFDTKSMNASYLQPARSWINPDQMRPKEPFTFKARDGLTLHGYITRPAGTGPYPMVVIPHGGPHGVRDYWEFDSEAQLFANRGYAVLQVNYRGSGGFGDEFEHKGYKEWGGKIQDDITDATRWAIDQKIAIPDRICIYGSSFGAYSALEGVIREPALYRCAIGYAGIYDLELMGTTADISHSKLGKSYLEMVHGTDKNILHEWSPVYTADRIQVPVFLIHGKEDWRADFEQATKMKSALEKNKKVYEWMALGKEGHDIHDEETRKEVYERILAFIDKYLKSPAN
jgi:dipeptidyl aminopeptidase/acylaminoacyl peptidase